MPIAVPRTIDKTVPMMKCSMLWVNSSQKVPSSIIHTAAENISEGGAMNNRSASPAKNSQAKNNVITDTTRIALGAFFSL